MSEKYLIIGATGSIGSNLSKQLKNKGYDIHLVARNEGEVKSLSSELECSYSVADVLKDGFVDEVKSDIKEIKGLAYCVGSIDLKPLKTVKVNDLPSCYIRPLVYLSYGEMGLNPLPCSVDVAIATWPWGAYLGDEGINSGVRMMISSWQRHDPNAMPPAAKGCGHYINSQMAKVQAVRAGYDEAILLSPQGYVSECTGENLFLVRNGVIVTPPTSAGALEGITQDSVRQIASDLDIEYREGNILRSDLYTAEEAFLSGTAAEVVPIRSVDDREIGDPGPVTRAIQERLFEAFRGKRSEYSDWNEYVN